jgi:hypothetical protein
MLRLCPFLRATVRDTSGTALYFMEYDGMRHLLGRLPSGEQGPTPAWLPIHASLVPFVCGSLSGVTSWALIYPMDVYVTHSLYRSRSWSWGRLCSDVMLFRVKTKVQQRALAGERYRGVVETLTRLIRGKSITPTLITIKVIIYPLPPNPMFPSPPSPHPVSRIHVPSSQRKR